VLTAGPQLMGGILAVGFARIGAAVNVPARPHASHRCAVASLGFFAPGLATHARGAGWLRTREGAHAAELACSKAARTSAGTRPRGGTSTPCDCAHARISAAEEGLALAL
jgi:hypothetical protein